MAKRLTISELRITGTEKTAAAIDFAPGLNLIVGASDTGKTFIFECLDFMFGANRGLRRLPESAGYDNVFLTVAPDGNKPFTLRRSFDGGDFELTETAGDGLDADPRKLSATHSADPGKSLSAYLLHQVGLGGKEVRIKKDGKKSALSFRDVSHFTLIDEERIIQQRSPILTGQFTTKTRERNIFAYFLTGQDDSQIISAPAKADEVARNEGEIAVLESLLAENMAQRSAALASDEVAAQAVRLDQSIAQLSEVVLASKSQIAQYENRRAELFDSHLRFRSRAVFVEEQLRRLRLLDDYYKSDRLRLEAVVEANELYDSLPEGKCPLCNRPLTQADNGSASAHDAFDRACRQEIQKIDVLSSDLKNAVTDFGTEEAQLKLAISEVQNEFGRIDSQLREVLAPRVQSAQSQMQALIQQRVTLAGEAANIANIATLERRLAAAKAVKPVASSSPSSFSERATTSLAFDFCKVVEEILRAWKYPNLGAVSFDSTKGDLVIGGQDRANKGKGYRALTYAAFTIGLMKYCRQKSIPHPGIVVLDTPLNPFKGPAKAETDEDLADEVKVAFYEYTAKQHDGDQIIIIENEEPPVAIQKLSKYHFFTKNHSAGRYGFFPVSPSQSTNP